MASVSSSGPTVVGKIAEPVSRTAGTAPPPPDIYQQARKYLTNLDDSTIRNMDVETLKLIVRRGELSDRLKTLLQQGLAGSAEAQELIALIKDLDKILEELRELDKKLHAAAIAAWKASMERGRLGHLETLLHLGIVDKVSAATSDAKELAVKPRPSRNRKREEERLRSRSDATDRLRETSRG